MGCDGPCMWVCIPVTGCIKSVVSLCLIIIAIVMMAHSGMDCEKVSQCYRDNNINKCSTTLSFASPSPTPYFRPISQPSRRRRSFRRLDATDELEASRSFRRLDATDELEAKLNTTWTPQNLFMGKESKVFQVLHRLKAKGPAQVQGRRLPNCYSDWDEAECKKDNDNLREESSKWGATFMIIGIVSIMTGGCNAAAGKLKQRRWMMIGMIFDILAMIVSAVVAALGYYISAILRIVCSLIEEWSKEIDTVNCWEDNADKVCEWAGMFFWGAVMLTILCVIYTTASILGCSATCCCPPKDAHWHPDNKQGAAQGGAPTTIGTPVGQPVDNENKA